MTDHSAATVAGISSAPGAKLEPDAIGAAQDTIIGMASSAPAATVGLSLAALAVATAYGSGPILILTAIPMLIIANAYRRLNLWKANTGASFEWVGRAINPYLGFLTGWLAIAGLVWVLSHHAGSVPFTRGWLSVSGINGKGDAVAGFLVAVFVYGGWDGTLYVNEEVKHRRVNPGRAAVIAVALLAIIYTLSQIGFQGVISPAKLQAASDNGTALVTVAQALGGGFWAKAMALSFSLTDTATTGTGIVLSARIVYGMASYRVLPEFLGTVSRRYATPAVASVIVGLLIVVLSAVYYLATSVQNAFFDVIDVTGLLFSIFYILTALAAVVYYRRRISSSAWDFVTVGVLPLGAAGFLGWIFVKSLGNAPWTQRWSLIGIVIAGLILMFSARFVLRSAFFQIPRESEVRPQHHRTGRH